MKTGADNVATLFKATFDRSAAGKGKNQPTKVTKDALDELSMEESAHYQQKISKYIQRSLTSVSDPCFWFIMNVAHRVREPWLHFYRFLCIKKRSDRLHIVELVSRAIYNIQSSFAQLVGTMNIWTNDAFTFASKVGTNDHEDDPVFQQSTMFSVAASLLLQNAATFDRRVVRQFQRLEFDSDGNLTLPTDCLAYSVNQILTLIMLMLGNTVRP